MGPTFLESRDRDPVLVIYFDRRISSEEKNIQDAEENEKTREEELKEVLDNKELQQVHCLVNLNNENNVRIMKQMKSRKLNYLKYGKGRQTAPLQRNDGSQQQRRWKSPQINKMYGHLYLGNRSAKKNNNKAGQIEQNK